MQLSVDNEPHLFFSLLINKSLLLARASARQLSRLRKLCAFTVKVKLNRNVRRKTFFIASPFLWLRGTVIFAIICKQLVAYICDSGSSFSLACLHLYARRINMFAGKMRRKCSKKARPKVSLLSSVAILCIISYKFFCPLLHSHIQKVSI